MFSTGVLAFCLVALARNAQADCIKSFSPTGPQISEMVLKSPDDWYSMRINCEFRNMGATLLDKFDILSVADKKLCGGGEVPFGITKMEDQYFGEHWQEIKVDKSLKKHFDTKKDAKLEEYDTGFGVLNLATGMIHFTDYNATFTCAVCQAKEDVSIFDIEMSSFGDVDELESDNHYFITVVSNEKQTTVHNLTKENQSNFKKQIVSKLGDVGVEEFVYEKSVLNSNGFLEMHFHCSINDSYYDWLDITDFQNVPLNSKYSMTVEDATNCPQTSVTGADGVVKVIDSGSMGSTHNDVDTSAWLLSQRTCKLDPEAGRSSWSKPTIWKVNHEPCSDFEQYANNIEYKSLLGPQIEYNQKHQLHQFVEPPTDVKGFHEVARLASREISVAGKLKSEMHDDLKQILATFHTNGKVVTVQEPRVNFVASGLSAKSHAVNGFTMTFTETGMGEIVEPIQLEVNKKGQPNQTEPLPTFSFTVSPGLIANSDRIAFAAFLKPMDEYDTEGTARKLEVDVVAVGDKVGEATSDGYVDIFYDISNSNGATNVTCSALSDDNVYGLYYGYLEKDSDSCKHLETTSKTQILCRCDTKTFAANNGVFSGTFAFKEIVRYNFEDDYQSLSNYSNWYKSLFSNDSGYDY